MIDHLDSIFRNKQNNDPTFFDRMLFTAEVTYSPWHL